jgi:hypothetical protein
MVETVRKPGHGLRVRRVQRLLRQGIVAAASRVLVGDLIGVHRS